MTVHIMKRLTKISIYIHDISEVESNETKTAICHKDLGWIEIDKECKVFVYDYLKSPMGKITPTDKIREALVPVIKKDNK